MTRPTRPIPTLLTVLALVLVTWPLAAAPEGIDAYSDHARPAALVEELAAIHPATDDSCYSTGEPGCWADRLRRSEALLAEHPDDVLVHVVYQDLRIFQPGPDRPAVEELRRRYAERLAERPGDPVAAYLHDRLLPAEERMVALREATERMPELPWPHRDALFRLSYVVDTTTSEELNHHLERFLDLNQGSPLWVLGYANDGRPEVWAPRVAELRRKLEASTPKIRSYALPGLWAVEFRTRPLSEHDEQRKRVLQDVEALQAAELNGELEWWQALQKGFELALAPERAEAARAGLAEQFPCSNLALRKERERWQAEHEHGGVLTGIWRAMMSGETFSAPPELLAAARQWTEKCPHVYRPLDFYRFAAAVGHPDLPEAELRREIDRFLATWEEHRETRGYLPTPYWIVGRQLLARGLDVERALELFEAERRFAAWFRDGELMDNLHEKVRKMMRFKERHEDLRITVDLAEAQLALDRLDVAEGELETARDLLDELWRNEAAQQRLLPYQIRHWQLRSELAEERGHLVDALAFAQRAEGFRPEGEEPDPRLHRLWQRLGGGEEGWQALRGRLEDEKEEMVVAEMTPWVEVGEPLRELELIDAEGRRWSREDLAGKAVLVNLWATWCMPCRAELPYVQELAEEVREREDVLVITFNTDADPGPVVPFLQSEGYDFPALLAQEYLADYGGFFVGTRRRIPQNWLIDPEGVVVRQQQGFLVEEADGWVAEMKSRLEALAPAEEGP